MLHLSDGLNWCSVAAAHARWRALPQSTSDLASLFEKAFADRRARVKGMPRRAVNMLLYLMQHDAHHRAQICALARDLGHEFRGEDMTRIWGWRTLPASLDIRQPRPTRAAVKG